MATQAEINKQRNRAIAENQERQQVAGNIRVSGWTIFFAIVAGVILFFIGWAGLHR